MKIQMRFRFWLEAGIATITSALLVLSLVWEEWIEEIFRVSPDGGNGSLERWIVGSLFVVTIDLFIMARYEWHRTRAAPSMA